MITVKVTGLNIVNKKMDKLRKEIEKAAKAALIESAIVDVESEAKRKITQDKHVKTGRLRASIHTAFKGKKTHRYSDMTGKSYRERLSGEITDKNVLVGTNVKYARKIERLDSYLAYAFLKARKLVPARIKKHVAKVLR